MIYDQEQLKLAARLAMQTIENELPGLDLDATGGVIIALSSGGIIVTNENCHCVGCSSDIANTVADVMAGKHFMTAGMKEKKDVTKTH